MSSAGDSPGVGDVISMEATKGALCGSGEMSIMSFPGAGEDVGGNGGVVATCSSSY
jgi:hypothetical protein